MTKLSPLFEGEGNSRSEGASLEVELATDDNGLTNEISLSVYASVGGVPDDDDGAAEYTFLENFWMFSLVAIGVQNRVFDTTPLLLLLTAALPLLAEDEGAGVYLLLVARLVLAIVVLIQVV
mmetsp:Transcript_85/g.120  ORF Transcript_85/g.120 Transcript_85/m.120 type:complete len:122 (-) Transcript_85:407-772(-)